MHKPAGAGELRITLLRPLDWIEAHAAAPRETIELDLPELGASGPAQVLAVGPCPPIEPFNPQRPGRVVAGLAYLCHP